MKTQTYHPVDGATGLRGYELGEEEIRQRANRARAEAIANTVGRAFRALLYLGANTASITGTDVPGPQPLACGALPAQPRAPADHERALFAR